MLALVAAFGVISLFGALRSGTSSVLSALPFAAQIVPSLLLLALVEHLEQQDQIITLLTRLAAPATDDTDQRAARSDATPVLARGQD